LKYADNGLNPADDGLNPADDGLNPADNALKSTGNALNPAGNALNPDGNALNPAGNALPSADNDLSLIGGESPDAHNEPSARKYLLCVYPALGQKRVLDMMRQGKTVDEIERLLAEQDSQNKRDH
jgi:hypothetical protein